MKKIILTLFLSVCAVCVMAQNYVEFLGMPINGNTKSKFIEKLTEKGFTYKGEMDGYVMYIGQFLGHDASVTLCPSATDDGITAIGVSLEELNPVKIGHLFAELTQKYMQKYSDYNYTTDTKSGGSTEIMLRKKMPNGLLEVVSLETKIKGSKFGISLFYGSGIQPDNNTATNNGYGIGMDDI